MRGEKPRIAYFDANGICMVASTHEPPGDFAHQAKAPRDASARDIWFDAKAKKVRRVRKVNALRALKLKEVAPIGVKLSVKAPAGAVLLIDGVAQDGKASIDTSTPRRVIVELRGRVRGRGVIAINSYAEDRRGEYPPIAEQLDALWKGGPEAEAMRERILAIKAKHPKPEGNDDAQQRPAS